jgi:GTP cyclohydrolase FolE2
MIKMIMKEKGITLYEVHKRMNYAGYVYDSFEKNRFTEKFIRKLEAILEEDLSFFINSK